MSPVCEESEEVILQPEVQSSESLHGIKVGQVDKNKHVIDLSITKANISNVDQEVLQDDYLSIKGNKCQQLLDATVPTMPWHVGTECIDDSSEYTAKGSWPILSWARYPRSNENSLKNYMKSQIHTKCSNTQSNQDMRSLRESFFKQDQKICSAILGSNQPSYNVFASEPCESVSYRWAGGGVASEVSEEDNGNLCSTYSKSFTSKNTATNVISETSEISKEELSSNLLGTSQYDQQYMSWGDSCTSQYQPWSNIPLREVRDHITSKATEEEWDGYDNLEYTEELDKKEDGNISLNFEDVLNYLSYYEAFWIHSSSHNAQIGQSSLEYQLSKGTESKSIIVKIANILCQLLEMKLNPDTPDAYIEEILKPVKKSTEKEKNPSWWGWWIFLFPHLSGLQNKDTLSSLVDFAFCCIIRKFQQNVPKSLKMGLKNLTVATINKQSTPVDIYTPYKQNINDTIDDMNSCLILRTVFQEVIENTVAKYWQDEQYFVENGVDVAPTFFPKRLCLGDFIQNEDTSNLPDSHLQIETYETTYFTDETVDEEFFSVKRTGIPYHIEFPLCHFETNCKLADDISLYFNKGIKPSYDADFPPLQG